MKLLKRQKEEQVIKPTFAEIVHKDKPEHKKVPKLIVKRINKDDKTDITERVAHYLIKEKTIQAKQI